MAETIEYFNVDIIGIGFINRLDTGRQLFIKAEV